MSNQSPTVVAQIAELRRLPMSQLWTLWSRYFDGRPEHTNRAYLESRIAYKLQEEAYGGIPAEMRRRLEEIGAQHSKINAQKHAKTHYAFLPGTQFLRDWGGRQHCVAVTPEGRFEYEGQCFKSLTAVARHITGAHMSGPLFFGLTEGKKQP